MACPSADASHQASVHGRRTRRSPLVHRAPGSPSSVRMESPSPSFRSPARLFTMRVLVTGSAGHLGEALLRSLGGPKNDATGLDIKTSPFTNHVGSITD